MKYIDNMTVHRLLQSISWYGKNYTFKRKKKNEYGEKDGTEIIVSAFKGLFHEASSSWLNFSTQDSATVRAENSYFIMTPWGNVKDLESYDTVEINGNIYQVSGIDNLSEKNIIAEITLELIQ